jgi:ABC-type multidrug transport system ATPase subunit
MIKPKQLLLDEPFSELDILTVKKVAQKFQEMKKETLIIFSTHTASFARQMSDQILFLTPKRLIALENYFSSTELLEEAIRHLMIQKDEK